jgi:N6-L-threonylcarbamoyladenine synthase
LEAKSQEQDWKLFVPRIEYCTDNAAMIGVTATFKYHEGQFVGQDIAPAARF